MDEQEMDAFVARVVIDSERTFRAQISPALLEAYAREAALDLWLSGNDVTVACANQALAQIREQIASALSKRRSEIAPRSSREPARSQTMLDLRSVAARHEQFQEEARRYQLLAQLEAPGGLPALRLRPVFDNLRRGLATRFSRRTLWGATAGIALGAASDRLPFAVSAAKKHRRKKVKFNAFGCVAVGGKCQGNNANCCSGICQGKKPKKGQKDRSRCVAHNSDSCQVGDDICIGNDVDCGEGGGCLRTTGDAPFCFKRRVGTCTVCSKDVECEALFGPGAACVVCPLECKETKTFCTAAA